MTDSVSPRYDRVAVALHWLMAICIIGMLLLGFFWEDIASRDLKIFAINFHKSLGLTLLLLAFFRLYWRLRHPAPALPETMPTLERKAARTAHIALYVLMIAIPLSGWMYVSALAKYPTVYFGLFTIPHLPIPKSMKGFFYESHELLAYGLIALLSLHLLAAMKHHFFDKNDVLRRILP
ncbi:MAG: cytochrome b [Alphaproteobacteria bacterium]|jgi:cytochrome b561